MIKNIIVYASALVLASGCNCVQGEGPSATKSFDTGEFLSGLHVDGAMDVRIKQGTPQSIVLTAQENLHELIQVEFNDGVVYISSKECYNTSVDSYIEITTPRLESITLDGAGDITGEGKFMLTELDIELDGAGNISLDVDAAEVHAELDGAGDITLSGETKELRATIDGAGDILASEMITETAETVINGAGDIRVYVKEKLDARVNGAGDIRYKGSPDVDQHVSGAGSISPL